MDAAAAAAAAEEGVQVAAVSRAELCFDADELLRLHGELAATDSPTKRAAAVAAAATHLDAGSGAEWEAAGSSSSSAEEPAGVGCGADGLNDYGDAEADVAGSFLEGLGETSAMLRAALAQHSSVMQLVGMLDGLGVAPGQAGPAQEEQQQQQEEQQEREREQEQAAAEWSSAAAHTAAWVAATAADEESAASGGEQACV
jgi:hypothetical protein